MPNILFFFSACALGLAWLLSNKHDPWVTAWNEGFAFLGLFLLLGAILSQKKHLAAPKNIVLLVLLFVLSTLLQKLVGITAFNGVAVIFLFYIFAFFFAFILGRNLEQKAFLQLAGILLAFTWLSSLVGLMQWLRLSEYFFVFISQNDGVRVFGNINQPNNFGSVCSLGLCLTYYLRHSKKIHISIALPILLMLSMAGILSGSRTFILQFFLINAGMLFLYLKRSTEDKNSKELLLPLGTIAFFIVFFIALPSLNTLLLLNPPRDLQAISKPDSARLHVWWTFLHAFLEKPWMGYGWEQVAAAYVEGSRQHFNPSLAGVVFFNAHNLIVNTLVSTGLLFGLAILSVFFNMLWRCYKACLNYSQLWPLFLCLLALVLHQMLEFPLDYAFLMIPFALLMGHIDSFDSRPAIQISRKNLYPSSALMVMVFALLCHDYLRLEAANLTLRFEANQIGTNKITTLPPNIYLADHELAYLRMAQTEKLTGLSSAQLAEMKKTAEYFPHTTTLSRYALALSVNGRQEEAKAVQATLCRINTAETCKAAQQAWEKERQTYPEVPTWE